MKTLLTAVSASVFATAASAGSLVYTPEAAPVMVEEAPMGGSGMWLVPLIAIALIALAMSNRTQYNFAGNGAPT